MKNIEKSQKGLGRSPSLIKPLIVKKNNDSEYRSEMDHWNLENDVKEKRLNEKGNKFAFQIKPR